jgi:beta-barrel assembly-enhancing protease
VNNSSGITDLTTEYIANAFAPESKTRTLSGKLRVSNDSISFQSPEREVTFPLEGVQIRKGGHNGEQLFFEHPAHPGWSLYCSDSRLSRNPVLASDPTFSKTLKDYTAERKRIPVGIWLLLGLFGLFLLAAAGLILLKDPLVKFVANQVPVEWEHKMGDQLFKSIEAQGKLITNSAHQVRLDAITARLVEGVHDARFKFVFHVMQDTNVNAFAMPGGHMVVLTGLLDKADSPEEIAGVLAHEIAHVTQRHSIRALVEKAGLFMLVQAIFGDVAGLAAVLTEGSKFLLEQKFSRNFEREADDIGWGYLLEAQIDPRGMTSFFRKLEKMEEQIGIGGSTALALLSTHPATEERIARLEKKWEKTNPKPVIKAMPEAATTKGLK